MRSLASLEGRRRLGDGKNPGNFSRVVVTSINPLSATCAQLTLSHTACQIASGFVAVCYRVVGTDEGVCMYVWPRRVRNTRTKHPGTINNETT